jgi:hypothetical protein
VNNVAPTVSQICATEEHAAEAVADDAAPQTDTPLEDYSEHESEKSRSHNLQGEETADNASDDDTTSCLDPADMPFADARSSELVAAEAESE